MVHFAGRSRQLQAARRALRRVPAELSLRVVQRELRRACRPRQRTLEELGGTRRPRRRVPDASRSRRGAGCQVRKKDDVLGRRRPRAPRANPSAEPRANAARLVVRARSRLRSCSGLQEKPHPVHGVLGNVQLEHPLPAGGGFARQHYGPRRGRQEIRRAGSHQYGLGRQRTLQLARQLSIRICLGRTSELGDARVTPRAFDRAFSQHLFGDRSGKTARLYRALGGLHQTGFEHFNNSPLKTTYFDDIGEAKFISKVKKNVLERTLARLREQRERFRDTQASFGAQRQTRDEMSFAIDASILAAEKALPMPPTRRDGLSRS